MFSLWLALGLLLVAVIYLHVRLGKLQRDSAHRMATLEAQLRSQQVSINGLTAGAVGVDKRLRSLKDREKELEQRQSTFESQQEVERPYGEAIRLVQQGASTQRLMQELDLSESEAELIVMLHGRNGD